MQADARSWVLDHSVERCGSLSLMQEIYMLADLILISRFATKPGLATYLAAAMPSAPKRSVLCALDNDEVVTLEAMPSDMTMDGIREQLTGVAANFAHYLCADVRRELLEFVEAPKPCAELFPDTPYVQLRHVEVKPDMMAQYRGWRDETIFDVVRGSDEISTFSAYHSVISGQPGVMFISGFSVEPEDYRKIFESDRYQSIVRQAGDRYITGGTTGLYTKIYRVEAAQAA